MQGVLFERCRPVHLFRTIRLFNSCISVLGIENISLYDWEGRIKRNQDKLLLSIHKNIQVGLNMGTDILILRMKNSCHNLFGNVLLFNPFFLVYFSISLLYTCIGKSTSQGRVIYCPFRSYETILSISFPLFNFPTLSLNFFSPISNLSHPPVSELSENDD